MSKAGQRILDGLRDAIDGNFASVTIDGQTWIRKDESIFQTRAALQLASEAIARMPQPTAGEVADLLTKLNNVVKQHMPASPEPPATAGWRTMESAPTDRPILGLYDIGNGRTWVGECRYDANAMLSSAATVWSEDCHPPMYWQPLPAAPLSATPAHTGEG